jgi:Fe-S-cluster containining protein
MYKRSGSCKRCGHCCKAIYLNFGMEHAENDQDRESAQDFLRWASLHENVTVKWSSKACAEVGYKTPCKHLIFDEEGKAGCSNYTDRPEMCKRYPDGPNPNCPGFSFVKVDDSENV